MSNQSSSPDEAVDPSAIDVCLTDITPEKLSCIGVNHGKPNLGVTQFSDQPFPANGVIFGINKRLMICLSVKRENRPQVRNVWFLVDTASSCSFVDETTMAAFVEPGAALPNFMRLAIQKPGSIIDCFMSHNNFKGVNILGMDALTTLNVTITGMHYGLKAFRLEDVE